MGLIYTKSRSAKKKKPTKKELELAASWAALQAKHAKPLEKGAKANGLPSTKTTKCKPVSAVDDASIETQTTVSANASFRKMQGSTAPRQVGAYTGTACLGVALMHKSNYTPVFQSEAAVDIAKMRR